MDSFFRLSFDLRSLRLLDLVLPHRCAACGNGEELVCPECRQALRRLDGTLCARCGAPTAWPVARCRECAGRRLSFASARAAVAYEGPARPLVAGWKERGLRPLAHEFASLVAEVVPRLPVDALTSVPGDPERSLKRGQNAAEALARELAACWEMPAARLLRRREPARPQRGLSREERRRNVRGSFTVAAPPPACVGLVDDVYTTGATVAAAATELRRAGARSVHVVTFARTVRR
jgi:ComF family protein